MLSMRQDQIDELCLFAHVADKEARTDLALKFISREEDYTSNFTGALRRIVNANSQTGLQATSYVLSPSDEKQTGCDATIVVASNGFLKVSLFEAKWPRLSHAYYAWDYSQTSAGLSHFSDQLDRQSLLDSRYAVFEMFYSEFAYGGQPSFMQDFGSSCVWHNDAITFDGGRLHPKSVWSRQDLLDLLQLGNLAIEDVLRSVCQCVRGTAVSGFGDPGDMARELNLSGDVLWISAGENAKA